MRRCVLAGLVLACLPAPAFAQTTKPLALDAPQTSALDSVDPRDQYGSPGEYWLLDAQPGIVYKVMLQSTQFDAMLEVELGANARSGARVIDDAGEKGPGHTDSTAYFSTTKAATVRIRAGTVQRGASGAYTIKAMADSSCDKITAVPFLYGCPDYVSPSGPEVERERQAKLAKIRADAAAGDPASMLGMHLIVFNEGRPDEAIMWLERSFAAGNMLAGRNLAELLSGRNPSKATLNYPRAIAVWKQLAERGSNEAMERLAQAYERGKMVGQDLPLALSWYKKAALAGSRSSASFLGQLYQYGTRTQFPDNRKNDPRRTSDYVQRVQAEGPAPLEVAVDIPASTYWYGVGAELNDRWSMYVYSNRLADGKGIAQNMDQSLRWLRKAAYTMPFSNEYAPANDALKAAVDAGLFK